MTRPSPVILLELNELTPSLLDRFIGEDRLPNFKRFRDESLVFTTDAEEQAPNLEPWIQWVTVHTGLPLSRHGVFHLDEGHKLDTKRVWEIVSDEGHPVWVCGSMNIRGRRDLRGALLPDPWCTKVPPTPNELTLYFRFVQQNVLEYSNSRIPLSKADYARFAGFMASHGGRVGTASTIAAQLVSERTNGQRWKRATLLDKLQTDVFRYYYRKIQPRFSTFFLNSTAHFQHSYWRNMEPEPFTVKPTAGEQEMYESAIVYGYEQMDGILGDFFTLAGSEATLVLCTALSQQPCLRYETQGGAVFHRPIDFAKLASQLGVRDQCAAAPVMTHQFHLEFATDDAAIRAETQLSGIQVAGRPALDVERRGNRVFSGSAIYVDVPADAVLALPDGGSLRFFDMFYKVDTMKSGMHHPDGVLWVRTPGRAHAVDTVPVPLTRVAPTLLDLCGVRSPGDMADPIPTH